MSDVNKMYFNWGECDDRHEDCKTWASDGLCGENSEEMSELCPWSCHKCAPEMLGKYSIRWLFIIYLMAVYLFLSLFVS